MATSRDAGAATGEYGVPLADRAPGELALVLHTHLPHVAGHGVWPVGEEWLLQAWATSWLPVTRTLESLAQRGRRDVLTLSVTPTTAWQVGDVRLAEELAGWIAAAMWRSEEQRWHHLMGPEVTALSTHWWRHFRDLGEYHASVQSRGGLLAVWDGLAQDGVIELLAGPATHPYLALEPDPRLIDAQLATGLAAHSEWTRPTGGLWPPELAYRPRGSVGDPTKPPLDTDVHGTPELVREGPELPGLEDHYAAHGITHIMVDGPTLIRAAGGADRDWTHRPDPVARDVDAPEDVLHDGVLIGDSDVVAFGRDLSVAYHVWSPSEGYPGNAWYLDHHATGGFGVHRSWRVTDRTLPPDAKQPYVPQRAATQAREDAQHFLDAVRAASAGRAGGLVVAAYDTELLGHWWHEGPTWLGHVLDMVADDPDLVTTTLRSRRERRPPTRRLALPESSWGYAKGHASWVTPDTREVWVTLRSASDRARRCLSGGRGAPGLREQIARELALLSASDWPFMMTRGRSPEYARERVAKHAERVHRLCDAVEAAVDTGERLPADAGDPVPPNASELLAAIDPARDGHS